MPLLPRPARPPHGARLTRGSTPIAAQPTYGAVHLYSVAPISDGAVEKIKACKALLSRVKTLKEITLDFNAVESRAFHTDHPEALQCLYGVGQGGQHQMCTDIARRLVRFGGGGER